MDGPPSCDRCIYVDMTILDDDEPCLICRRFPPRLFMENDELSQIRGPQVDASDWCGEFREKIEFIVNARRTVDE